MNPNTTTPSQTNTIDGPDWQIAADSPTKDSMRSGSI